MDAINVYNFQRQVHITCIVQMLQNIYSSLTYSTHTLQRVVHITPLGHLPNVSTIYLMLIQIICLVYNIWLLDIFRGILVLPTAFNK